MSKWCESSNVDFREGISFVCTIASLWTKLMPGKTGWLEDLPQNCTTAPKQKANQSRWWAPLLGWEKGVGSVFDLIDLITWQHDYSIFYFIFIIMLSAFYFTTSFFVTTCFYFCRKQGSIAYSTPNLKMSPNLARIRCTEVTILLTSLLFYLCCLWLRSVFNLCNCEQHLVHWLSACSRRVL